jgi:hypothetical protein
MCPADGDLVKASSRTIEYRRLLNGERRAISVGLAPSSTESPPEVVQHEVSLWLGIVGTWVGFVRQEPPLTRDNTSGRSRRVFG